MKLLLKKGDLFTRIIKANFYGNKVIGELYLFEYLQKLIPNGVDFHSHFIYFKDGNYHFSIKYFDKVENVFVDRKTYYNHISTKKSLDKDFKICITEKRDKQEQYPLDMFMMSEKMRPWTEQPIQYNFGTFRIHSDYTGNFKWQKNLPINKDDIVIDLSKHPNKSINFAVVIYSKEDQSAFNLRRIENAVIEETMVEQDHLILKVYALILPI